MASVLIVDDALFMRRLIREALEPLGFTIAGEAAHGVEALAQIEAALPDLVTLDIVMPEMDGLETLRALRERAPKLPVIMVTAVDQRDAMRQAMRLGVADFVVKPFTADRIVSAAEKALSGLDQPSTGA